MTLSTGAKWLGGGSSSRISGGPPEARGASSIPPNLEEVEFDAKMRRD